jgi:hypothetical protein
VPLSLNKQLRLSILSGLRWPCSLRVGLQVLDCWVRVFESRWGHGCSSLVFCIVSVVTPATSWSLVHRNPIECVCVCVCVCVWEREIWEPQEWGCLGPCCVTTSQKKVVSLFSIREDYLIRAFVNTVGYFIFHKMLVISRLYHLVKLLQFYGYVYSACVKRS